MINHIIDLTERALHHRWAINAHWSLASEVLIVTIPPSAQGDLEHAKLSSFGRLPAGDFFLLVTADRSSFASVAETLLTLIEDETERRYRFIGHFRIPSAGFTALAYRLPVQI